MARLLLAALFSLVSASALAAGPAETGAFMRHYDAAEVAAGKIQVSVSGDVAWVSGTSVEGPWIDVWRRAAGEWKMIGELAMREFEPIRFGVKRHCRRTS